MNRVGNAGGIQVGGPDWGEGERGQREKPLY